MEDPLVPLPEPDAVVMGERAAGRHARGKRGVEHRTVPALDLRGLTGVDVEDHGVLPAVLGAGAIGLVTMLAALASGSTAVAITDVVPDKLARALRLGATAAVDGRDGSAVDLIKSRLGGRPDVVFDCVSTQASFDQAMALSLKGGTVVVVGIAERSVQMSLPLVQDREVRIQGSALYLRDDVMRALDLVRNGHVPVSGIVTATYPLDQAREAFEAARSGHHVKVHISVP